MERLFEIPRQGEVFLLLLGSGVLLGALWQGLGFLRRRLPRCGAVWDVLFALSLGGTLLLALLRWREQRLRLYALLGVCLGAALYLAGPGAAVDALFALSLGGTLLLALLRWREQRLRLYALLGVCLGAALYLAGPGAAVDALCRHVRKKALHRQEKQSPGANLPPTNRSGTSEQDASLHP